MTRKYYQLCPYCGWTKMLVTLHGMNVHIGKKHPDKSLLGQNWKILGE